jgi:hypothetical protein
VISTPSCSASEGFILKIIGVEVSDTIIIKFKPLVSLVSNITKVMSILCKTDVNHHSFESVLILFRVVSVNAFHLLESVLIQIQIMGELPSSVYLLVLKFIVIKANTLQMQNQEIG